MMKNTLLVLTVMLALPGCIYDDLDDCPSGAEVAFVYDRNMKFADAASSEISSVALFAADADGKIVYRKDADETVLSSGGCRVDVSDIPAGKYTFIAWALGEDRHENSFSYPSIQTGKSSVSDLYRYISNDGGNVGHDITPLFYGSMEADLSGMARGKRLEYSMEMTKNTNVFRILLQQISGTMESSDFRFEITDDNAYMDWTNALTCKGEELGLGADSLAYAPWAVSSGSAGVTAKSADGVNVVLAEFTTGRLMADRNPVLTVYNPEGERILRIPLVDYALLVKGNYNRNMADQEYLDRQDEYNMTFFLDTNMRWINSSIIINSWRVILDDVDL